MRRKRSLDRQINYVAVELVLQVLPTMHLATVSYARGAINSLKTPHVLRKAIKCVHSCQKRTQTSTSVHTQHPTRQGLTAHNSTEHHWIPLAINTRNTTRTGAYPIPTSMSDDGSFFLDCRHSLLHSHSSFFYLNFSPRPSRSY